MARGLRFGFFLFVAAAAIPRAAIAQSLPAAELTWLCWLDSRDDFHIRCRLEEDPLAQALAADAAVLPAALAVPVDQRAIRLELFRPGRSPNVARMVREQPAQFAPLVWSIPLHAIPYDDSPLQDLAQSVMCGSDRHCTAFIGAAAPAQIARR